MADPTEEEKVRRMISDALSLNTLEAASAPDLRRLEQTILSAIAAEREKAAKVAEMKFAAVTGTWSSHYVNAGIAIAAAIRSGDKPE